MMPLTLSQSISWKQHGIHLDDLSAPPKDTKAMVERGVPWITKKKAWSSFRTRLAIDYLLNYKQMKAKARYVQRQSQHSSFQAYISSINSPTRRKKRGTEYIKLVEIILLSPFLLVTELPRA